jgi:template-activating factor I
MENLEDDDFDGDVGSWFHYFTNEGDAFDIGETIVSELLQDPIKVFEGLEDDDEDELDDELDDDEGSVDLEADEEEAPAKKRQRN